MLGGYNRHTQGPKLWARMKLLPKPARMALANFLTSVPAARWSQLVPQKPQFGIAVHKAASILTLDDPKSIYDRLTAQWYQNPVLESDVPATLLEDFEWQVPHDLSFAEQMMVWDVLSYLPGDILTKVDRASMAVGLEVRAPLLDWRVYDFVWSLPESYKIRGGKGKYLLRKVLERYVPNDLFERPKQGFTMPVGEWLRGPLRDWAEELLDEKKLEGQGHLDAAMIRHAWDEHLAGRGQHELKLWTALMFQAWHAHWIEG